MDSSDAVEASLQSGILLSDMVIREHGTGKLSLIGIFDRFLFPAFPANCGRIFVSVGVTNFRNVKMPELNMTCRFEVANTGHVVFSSAAKVEFQGDGPLLNRYAVIQISFPIIGMTFQSAGLYSIAVLLNNEPLGQRYVEVLSSTAANPS